MLCRDHIKFSVRSESEILKAAEVDVWRAVYYDASKRPIANGLLDPKMVKFSPFWSGVGFR